MKYSTVLTSTIVLAAAMGLSASAAVAAPKGPAPKATVMHCGCNVDGTDLEYTTIAISSRSKGHDAHVAGSIDSCFDGVDTYTDFIRLGDDCQIDGPPLGDPIDACVEPIPMEGESCGATVMQP
ncbi:MAG: hypothetical protein PVI15_06000 [Chromatiales bacterium]|jgi:hypothetical protein